MLLGLGGEVERRTLTHCFAAAQNRAKVYKSIRALRGARALRLRFQRLNVSTQWVSTRTPAAPIKLFAARCELLRAHLVALGQRLA